MTEGLGTVKNGQQTYFAGYSTTKEIGNTSVQVQTVQKLEISRSGCTTLLAPLAIFRHCRTAKMLGFDVTFAENRSYPR